MYVQRRLAPGRAVCGGIPADDRGSRRLPGVGRDDPRRVQSFATGHTSCRLAAIRCLVPLAGLAGRELHARPDPVHQQIRPGQGVPCPEPQPDDIRDPPTPKCNRPLA
jgi:hypothetical protein